MIIVHKFYLLLSLLTDIEVTVSVNDINTAIACRIYAYGVLESHFLIVEAVEMMVQHYLNNCEQPSLSALAIMLFRSILLCCILLWLTQNTMLIKKNQLCYRLRKFDKL